MKHFAFWASIFFMQVSFGSFYNFFTIYELEHGLSLETISYLWAFGVICEILMLYCQAPILKSNLLNIIKFCVGVTAFRWILLYLYPNSLEVVFFTQAIHAFSFALFHSAVVIYLYSLYDNKKLAQQFMFGVGYGLGGFVGALSAGRTSGGSERNRNAGRADACQIAGSDGAANCTHNPRTPDHERRSYGGGRGSSGCRDPRINRKLPQCERGRPAQDRPRFICIRPSRSNR
jgi:hypothetical protein